MEPLTALAFAGNILQFVEFTSDIISASREIYRSVDGISEANLELEDIYQKLSDLSSHLTLSRDDNNGFVSKTKRELSSLGASCKADCERLLMVIGGLRVENKNGRRWQSFRAALKYAWKDEQEIEDLSSRLKNKQQILNLHISVVTSNHLRSLLSDSQRLVALNKKSDANHSTRLDDISHVLGEIKYMIASMKELEVSDGFSSSDIEELTCKFSEVSLSERDIAKEQAILKSLNFKLRTTRYDAIINAHTKTFNWVFDDAGRKGLGGEKFLDWVKSSGGVFWISGKPGSGKSTLMKFLADHEQTRQAASSWSTPDDVIISSHYFWIAGDHMQKSQQGLLQALLYNIFRQYPQIIRKACGQRWEGQTSYLNIQQWSLEDLQQTFVILSSDETLGYKFLFFIDGLDEYDGDHIDLCQFLKDLAGVSSRIKICAASRPWNAFEESFGIDTIGRINLHELTHEDILQFAQSRLTGHPRWDQLVNSSEAVQPLIEKIASRAQGVFLWVKLVTQSLRDGMTNYDTLNDLQKRFESLPTDLKSLYRLILDSVEPVYHQRMAETLLIMSETTVPNLPWRILAMHERSYEDPHYAFHTGLKDPHYMDWELAWKRTTRRTMSSSRGILEVGSTVVTWIHRTAHDFMQSRTMQTYLKQKCRPNFDAGVAEFRARVACQLLPVRKSYSYMGPESSVNRLLTTNRHTLRTVLDSGELRYNVPNATNLQPYTDREAFELVDHLTARLSSTSVLNFVDPTPQLGLDTDLWTLYESAEGFPLSTPIDLGLIPEVVLLSNAYRYGLLKLKDNPGYFKHLAAPALWHVLYQPLRLQNKPHQDLMHQLLKHGYDLNCSFSISDVAVAIGRFPNQRTTKYWDADATIPEMLSTPWVCCVGAIGLWYTWGPTRKVEKRIHWSTPNINDSLHLPCWKFPKLNMFDFKYYLENGILSTLLRYGADPNAKATPFTVVWTNFVCAAFTANTLHEVQDAYLQALDEFFNGGARLGASTIGQTLDPESLTTRLPWRMITGWEMFCEHLEHMSLLPEQPEISFIAKVTTRMIKQAVMIKWPLGRLNEILQKVFPEDLRKPMVELTGQVGSYRHAKRNAAEYSSTEREAKRPKMVCSATVDT